MSKLKPLKSPTKAQAILRTVLERLHEAQHEYNLVCGTISSLNTQSQLWEQQRKQEDKQYGGGIGLAEQNPFEERITVEREEEEKARNRMEDWQDVYDYAIEVFLSKLDKEEKGE